MQSGGDLFSNLDGQKKKDARCGNGVAIPGLRSEFSSDLPAQTWCTPERTKANDELVLFKT